MQYAFFYDQSRCIGCNACSVACKDYNQVNPGPVRWRDQRNFETGASVFENLSMACNHCASPACLTACPVQAITKTDKGIVLVDKTKCQSLQSCVTACPFAAPHIATDQQEPSKFESWKVAHPMQKCNYCHQRVENGDTPSCVGACPVHALDYGDMTTLQQNHPDAVQVNPTDFPYAYANNTTDTMPSFLIKKRKTLTITPLQTS